MKQFHLKHMEPIGNEFGYICLELTIAHRLNKWLNWNRPMCSLESTIFVALLPGCLIRMKQFHLQQLGRFDTLFHNYQGMTIVNLTGNE